MFARNPKVSVIVPVYNKSPVLQATLASLSRQNLGDCEFIIVDDCSTDNSLEVIRRFTKEDKRFQLVRRTVNGGLSVARNTGLAHAEGDYILFWDADDLLRPAACRQLYLHARRSKSDLVKGILMRRKGNRVTITKRHAPLNVLRRRIVLEEFPEIFRDISSCAYFIRRSLLTETGLTFEPGLFMQDVLFSTQLYLSAQAISVTPIKIGQYVQYHQTGSSAISDARYRSLEVLLTRLKAIIDAMPNVQKNKLAEHIYETYINAAFNHFYVSAVTAVPTGNKANESHKRLIHLSVLIAKIPDSAILLHGLKAQSSEITYELLFLKYGFYDICRALRKGRRPNYREIKQLMAVTEDPVGLMQTMSEGASALRQQDATQVNDRQDDQPKIAIRAYRKTRRLGGRILRRIGLRG